MDEIIEIFGKRLKVVKDNDDNGDNCYCCAIENVCFKIDGRDCVCEDARGRTNRHFELVNDKK